MVSDPCVCEQLDIMDEYTKITRISSEEGVICCDVGGYPQIVPRLT